MASSRAGSILAVDFGNVHTRANLIDLVDGVYRLVAHAEARTTAGFPADDVAVGLGRALSAITALTGRQLHHSGGQIIIPEQPDRSGVDTFLATASIGHPLRTVLVGLVPDASVAAAARAVAGTYAQIVDIISLDDQRGEEDQLNAIVLSRPDLIFIAGGTEDGAQEPVLRLARTVALALPLVTTRRPPSILYAGNSALVPAIRELFEPLTAVFIAPNVRPSLAGEQVDAARLQLALAFDALSSQRGAGFDAIVQRSHQAILPTPQTYAGVLSYMDRVLAPGALVVDVGSAIGTLAAAYQGESTTVIRTDLGVGHSAVALVDAVGVEAIRAWIPFHVDEDELQTYALNKELRPATVPETVRDLYLEHALLRAAMQALLRASALSGNAAAMNGTSALLLPLSSIIAAGAPLTRTGRPGLAALLLLDALAPTGVTTLYADPGALLPALGAIGRVNPAAVVHLLDGGLERLGTSFSLSGVPRAGRAALHIEITPVAGGPTITHELDGGHLWVYPLPASARARVHVRVVGSGGLSIGGRRRLRLEVWGGSAGLIFDARGRPLPVAADLRARAAQMPLWFSEATGEAAQPIDEQWLTPSPRERAQSAEPELSLKEQTRQRRRRQVRDQAAASRRERQRADSEGGELDDLRDILS